MKLISFYSALLAIGAVVWAPARSWGQHDICLTPTVPASALTCAFGVKPLSLTSLLNGQPYVSPTDRAQTPYATFLYPNSNTMPAAHRASGQALAKGMQPLDTHGKVDLANGKIAVIVEGMSNTLYETNALLQFFLQNNPAVNLKISLVNKSIAGCPLVCWAAKGVAAVDSQVQIVLMKHSNNTPQEPNGMPRFPEEPFTTIASKRFPSHAQTTKGMLKTRILDLKKKYPNLKLLYLTSRSYGGWTCEPSASGNGEPVALEEGFSVKWLLEDQILNKDPDLAFSGPNARAPWLGWGPYLWDPTWTRDMYSDGVHPCPPGQMNVAQKWYNFLMQDSTARLWFRDNVLPATPAQLTTKVISTSRIDLAWNAAADNSGSVKYKIYRSGALLRTTAATTHADAGLNPATLYCYTISAIDSAGNESAKSAQVCATTTTTEIVHEAAPPLEFKLFQNHPNPLGPETVIRFQLPMASQVVVKIYNTVGAEIRTLMNAPFAAGVHTILWDGKDAHGEWVANGIYLYQLRASPSTSSGPGFSQVKRMALLR